MKCKKCCGKMIKIHEQFFENGVYEYYKCENKDEIFEVIYNFQGKITSEIWSEYKENILI